MVAFHWLPTGLMYLLHVHVKYKCNNLNAKRFLHATKNITFATVMFSLVAQVHLPHIQDHMYVKCFLNYQMNSINLYGKKILKLLQNY